MVVLLHEFFRPSVCSEGHFIHTFHESLLASLHLSQHEGSRGRDGDAPSLKEHPWKVHASLLLIPCTLEPAQQPHLEQETCAI